MQPTIFQAIRAQLATVPPVTTQDLSEKTVVVVGANVGLGFEAAKHFAQMSPRRLIMACRSRTKGEEAVQNIKQATGFSNVELRLVDLSSFKSVNQFVENLNNELDRLDILLLNAATNAQADIPTTEDGWELTCQTNALSPALLALLLLPKLTETGTKFQTIPRLVIVSSDVHYYGKFKQNMVTSSTPLRVFGSMEYFDPTKRSFMEYSERYVDTKLLNVFFTRALAARSDGSKSSPVIINTVNPGFCISNLRKLETIPTRLINWIMEKIFARTTEEGSRQLVWACLGSENGNERALHGKYLSDMRVLEAADYVVEEKELEDKLWTDLIRELEQVNPRVQEVVQEYLRYSDA